MGLDMYLSASRYLSGWDHDQGESERKAFADALKAAGLSRADIDDGAPSGNLSFHVGYWRKANAIHSWFVKNVQDGKDDCGEYSVSREQLAELRAECQAVLNASPTTEGNVKECEVITQAGRERKYRKGTIIADPSVALERLPTQSGFFFGSTDYDEGYVQDLQDTIAIVNRALGPKFEGWGFKYSASW